VITTADGETTAGPHVVGKVNGSHDGSFAATRAVADTEVAAGELDTGAERTARVNPDVNGVPQPGGADLVEEVPHPGPQVTVGLKDRPRLGVEGIQLPWVTPIPQGF
jgi:hypothetical protein